MKVSFHSEADIGFPFVAYVPNHISERPALIVQLHGAGERGNGNDDLNKVLFHGFSQIVNDNNLKDCVLVMPQCPTDSFWVAKIESLKTFVDQITDLYHIDTDRIYLCGLSMGGFGTWYTAMAYPELFAAIAPCCGGGMAWNAGVLKMPIWTFHGKDDTVVSVNQTLEMAAKLKDQGNNQNIVLLTHRYPIGSGEFYYAANFALYFWIRLFSGIGYWTGLSATNASFRTSIGVLFSKRSWKRS